MDRKSAIGLALISAVGVTACSGGGGNSNAAARQAPEASVSDLEGAREHAISVLLVADRHYQGMYLAPGQEPEPEPDPDPLPIPFPLPGGSQAKATTTACDQGEVTESRREENPGSPYSDAPMSITRLDYRSCRRHEGPESAPQRDYFDLHGRIEVGSAEEDARRYVRASGPGGSGEVHAVDEFTEAEHGHRIRVELTADVLNHQQQQSDAADAQGYHHYRVRYYEQGRLLHVDSERFGTPQQPFHANESADGLLVEGPYDVQRGDCPRTQGTVITEQRLVIDPSVGYIAGRLQISANGERAWAEYSSDGSVQIQSADGRTETFSREQQRDRIWACAPPLYVVDGD